ncbi:AbrB/MazE/SpoVT family DNA-binding domain-containing protein [Sulfurimonas sp. HSL-1716]|uniref:AbrB/MazE/SpoVT family DNA-binding domain-containing protein n=1 Tax=Hydrocurvibacter sulfurireducens TaxID=3131937 RepID=UPI0031F87F3F
MTTLIKIGNSQGIRLPKTIIKQAHLESANLEFEVVENGLLIKPVNNVGREAWKENINSVLSAHKNKKDEALLDDLLDDSDLDDYEW